MKKFAALALGLWLCLTAATAAGGSEGDPLVSLSYLDGAFFQELEAAVNKRLDEADWAEAPETAEELLLNEGDVLSGVTGMPVTLLGGTVRLDASGGAVVDVTEGVVVPAGQTLAVNHRYIASGGAGAGFVVDSAAAVLSCEGGGVLTPGAGPDYFAIARALRDLGLFRGSGSGFGEGFDLHLTPTRGEGLVMFLRLLGEEEQALAWEGEHPFTDVPGWLEPYVAWAYEKGYANGVAADRFGSGQTLSAVEFVEFLLRALGHSTAGVDDYTTSLERALACGALSEGEAGMLREREFLRAHVAYVSYYALDADVKSGGMTLARRLEAAGVLTEEQLEAAREQVDSLRL